ncbi:MAG: nuclease, partial [Pseudomonadota bacterium]
VLARIVQPAEAADAYVAMVEENEIRAGLSYYERARTVVRSLEAGAFSSEREALQTLYAAASRPRRSKIGSFITLVRALDTDLSWPTHIPERLGLELSRRLTAEPAFAEAIKAALSPQATAPAEELLRLEACLAAPQSDGTGHSKPAPAAASKSPPSPAPKPTHPTADVQLSSELEQGRIVLSGSGVTAAFAQRLETWLKGQHG